MQSLVLQGGSSEISPGVCRRQHNCRIELWHVWKLHALSEFIAAPTQKLQKLQKLHASCSLTARDKSSGCFQGSSHTTAPL